VPEGRSAAAVGAPSGSPDEGVPWHYGDPFTEQRALLSGRAIVDLSHRRVLAVTGTERAGWLHSLTTQHLSALRAGDSALTLILDPKGRVEDELHLVETGDECLLIVEADRVAAVGSFLESMRFLLDVQVRDASAEWSVVGVHGADGEPDGPAWVMPEGFRVRLDRREVLVPRGDFDRILAEAPGVAGTWAWEALRVAAGIPRVGVDTDNRTIPHEVGWIGPAVHLSKGCYRGQETVARVQNRGRPPRRLVLLHLDGSAPGQCIPGWSVWADGVRVGVVGSTAQHFELGPIALATVKRNTPVETALSVAPPIAGTSTAEVFLPDQAVAATQEVIVSPS